MSETATAAKPVFDYLASSALTMTMAGNTGISPFLTLFLLGLIEKIDSSWLDMGEMVENILASWWCLIVLGLLTFAEILGKCIPALDEVIDSIEVVVVPILSIFSTLATLGMLPSPAQDDAVRRHLEEDAGSFGAAFLTATKVVLVILGIGLSLLIHLLKMIIRVSSLLCSGGCCQPCITTLEIIVVCTCVVVAILSPIFAMVACCLFLLGAWYVITVKCCCKKKKDETKDENSKDAAPNEEPDVETAVPPAATAKVVTSDEAPSSTAPIMEAQQQQQGAETSVLQDEA